MARLPKATLNAELDIIEGLIAQHPQGIGRPALERAFAEAQGRIIPWRTLLRRLERLIAEGRVRTEGESTRLVYRPGPALVLDTPDVEENYVPLSREGARVRALVRRPIMARSPVGYDREFLERYRPGKTWYLPDARRRKLHERGRTPESQRPAGTYARDIYGRLLIDLAWASSRLEGNTYSRLDTQNLIEFGQRAEGKEIAEAQMILNHKAAIEILVTNAERIDFDRFSVLSLHAALGENLLGDPADEGRLRTRAVEITGTVYRPPAVPQLVEQYFDLFLEKARAIPDPFEQAFFAMVHLPYLQPFTDVNKRTSRLAANIPLVKANLCPLSFVDVPEQAYVEGTLGVYELTRVELLRDVFEWAYERSCAQYKVVRDALGEPDPVRLRYRSELRAAVRQAVREHRPPNREWLRGRGAAAGVPAADLDAFAERALALLLALSEDAAGRYDLLPSEYRAWREHVVHAEHPAHSHSA